MLVKEEQLAALASQIIQISQQLYTLVRHPVIKTDHESSSSGKIIVQRHENNEEAPDDEIPDQLQILRAEKQSLEANYERLNDGIVFIPTQETLIRTFLTDFYTEICHTHRSFESITQFYSNARTVSSTMTFGVVQYCFMTKKDIVNSILNKFKGLHMTFSVDRIELDKNPRKQVNFAATVHISLSVEHDGPRKVMQV